MKLFFRSGKIERGLGLLLAALFLLFLWLPVFDSILDLDKGQWINEKRALAKFPEIKWSIAGIRSLPGGLDSYYNDHFGFRVRLIRLEQKLKREIFKGPSRNDVMIGQDGWLFYTREHMIEHFRGAKKFSPSELEKWRELLEKRRNWLAGRGIKYLFVLAPDKQTIYPEYLPEWLRTKGRQTRLDQFTTYMKEHSTVKVLDLRPPLLKAKKTAFTYLSADTHWNCFGAFIAYQSVVQTLASQIPDLSKGLPYEAFKTTCTIEKGGDLANMLGQQMEEKAYVKFEPRPPLRLPETKTDINIYEKKWETGKLPAYTINPSQKHTLLSFRDSFSEALIPFLGLNFRKAVYIWQYNWDSQVIDRQKPDVVIDQMLERSFNTADPKQLMLDDRLL